MVSSNLGKVGESCDMNLMNEIEMREKTILSLSCKSAWFSYHCSRNVIGVSKKKAHVK